MLERVATASRASIEAAHCVMHAATPIMERPPGCTLCTLDILERLRLAIDLGRQLHEWRADAVRLLTDLTSSTPPP